MLRHLPNLAKIQSRNLSKGLIFPIYLDDFDTFKSEKLTNSTIKKLKINEKTLKSGGNRSFYHEQEGYDILTVVNLHKKEEKKKTYNCYNEENEFIRTAIGNAVNSLKGSNIDEVEIASPENGPEAFSDLAAEAAFLAAHSYKEKDRKKCPEIHFQTKNSGAQKGKIYADSQNLARDLMEAPANKMTPAIFAETVQKK